MRRAVFLLFLSLSLSGCGNLYGVRLLMPEGSGLELAAPDLYVETGMPAPQRAELIAAKDWAEAAVRRSYGEVVSTPIVHACWSEACYERFGGMGSKAL